MGEDSLKKHGWPIERILQDANALHFNGPNKPGSEVMFACPQESMPSRSLAPPTTLTEIWQQACYNLNICKCTRPINDAEDENDGLNVQGSSSLISNAAKKVGTKRQLKNKCNEYSGEGCTMTEKKKVSEGSKR